MISSVTGLNLSTIRVWLTKINMEKFSSITGLNLRTIRVWLTKINMNKFSSITGLNLSRIRVWLTKINMDKFSSITGLNLSRIRVWLTKINMDKFSSITVNQYILYMTVSKSENVTNWKKNNATLDNENQKIYKQIWFRWVKLLLLLLLFFIKVQTFIIKVHKFA